VNLSYKNSKNQKKKVSRCLIECNVKEATEEIDPMTTPLPE
jgi:hypothetical protein